MYEWEESLISLQRGKKPTQNINIPGIYMLKSKSGHVFLEEEVGLLGFYILEMNTSYICFYIVYDSFFIHETIGVFAYHLIMWLFIDKRDFLLGTFVFDFFGAIANT